MKTQTEHTYFCTHVLGSTLSQLIPVSWYVKEQQRIASTKETISTWIASSIKTNRNKAYFPLIQATINRQDRVTKAGKPLKTSLVFMDLDGNVSDQAFTTLSILFEDTNAGCCFRSYTPGRAKVAFAVQGRPSHEEMTNFVLGMFKTKQLGGMGLPRPDTAFGALTTAFIYSEGDLGHLAAMLPVLHVHSNGEIEKVGSSANAVEDMLRMDLAVDGVGQGVMRDISLELCETIQMVGQGQTKAEIGQDISLELCETIHPLSTPTVFDAISDEFDAVVGQVADELLGHNYKPNLYEGPLPKSLFGRKASLAQEIVLRFALSMPLRLLGLNETSAGLDIPCTVIQKLMVTLFPEQYSIHIDDQGKLASNCASKAIRALVERGVLAVVDPNYIPGSKAKSYIAVHPDLIDIAIEVAGAMEKTMAERSVEDVDKAWKRITGFTLAETEIAGCSNTVLYALTNYCPSLEVYMEAAMLIPGVSSNASRVSRLEYQWRAHLRKDARKSASAVIEGELVAVLTRG